MGIITLVVLGLTLVGMAFGALFGFIRGRERALLRLVLVVISAFLALALRGAVVDTIMNINVEGAPLRATLLESFGSEIPEGLTNLIFAFMEILIGFVAYFILLFVLRFLSWILVFPFLKLIIRGFENIRKEKLSMDNDSDDDVSEKPVCEDNASTDDTPTESEEPAEEEVSETTVDDSESTEDAVDSEEENPSEDVEPVAVAALEETQPVKKVRLNKEPSKKTFSKHRGQGALVGLVQGVLVAYFLFAPLTCLLTQVNRIASFKMNGKALVPIPEEIGITEYTESAIGKFYNSTGRWYYKIMTTTTDAKGNKVSLDATLNSVSVILDVVNVATSLENDFNILNDENATHEEKISALNTLSDKLISVGTSMKEIDEGTKDMMVNLITEMGGSEVSEEEIQQIKDMMTPEIFEQAGGAMKSYAEYEQVKLDGVALEEDKAKEIVKNAYSAIDLVGEAELEVNEADKATFKAAIDSNEDIAAGDVEKMYKIFGITVE